MRHLYQQFPIQIKYFHRLKVDINKLQILKRQHQPLQLFRFELPRRNSIRIKMQLTYCRLLLNRHIDHPLLETSRSIRHNSRLRQ